MTMVRLQFHAEASEMIDLAVKWAETYGFRLAAEQFFPDYRVVELTTDNPAEAYEKVDQIRRIAFRRGEFDLTASTTHQFVTRNEDCLYLSIQWPTEEGLRESAIGGVTDDKDLLRAWRQMIRELKTSMHKGAVIRGWTGITGPAPAHRHTVGAHKLAERGVKMLAVAGGSQFLFDDVSFGSANEL